MSWRLLIRLVSLVLLAAAGWLTYREWQEFEQSYRRLPSGSVIAGVPVGGLDRQQAAERVQAAYSTPVELRIGDGRFLLDPAQAGFELDLEAILPPEPRPDWNDFRDALWNAPRAPLEAPLQATFSEEAVRAFLTGEVASRYNQPARAAMPVMGEDRFLAGAPGTVLDVEASIPLIGQALQSLDQRHVDLPVTPVAPEPPQWEHLELMLKNTVRRSGFDGLAGVYLLDLENGQEIHFALKNGQPVAVEPDIAFTASSIIKIPILISTFNRLENPPEGIVDGWIVEMIANSSNDAADQIMRTVIDEVRGPLVVSEEVHSLGLENTFLAGYFSLGSPLLQIFETPANLRTDVNTDPDMYNQTTASDIGRLLGAIYQCAESNSGLLLEKFAGRLTAEECGLIIEYLKKDREPYMLMAGLPEATPIAHKHGYASFEGVIHTIGDAGLIFSPGGDYALAVFINDPELLLWDPTNELIAALSRTVYHFYNIEGTGS